MKSASGSVSEWQALYKVRLKQITTYSILVRTMQSYWNIDCILQHSRTHMNYMWPCFIAFTDCIQCTTDWRPMQAATWADTHFQEGKIVTSSVLLSWTWQYKNWRMAPVIPTQRASIKAIAQGITISLWSGTHGSYCDNRGPGNVSLIRSSC